MGVNKPDLRWVAHYHVPGLLTEYVQEIGRAGRDGQPAQALSLVSERTGWLDPTDQQRSQFFQEQAQKIQQTAIQLIQNIPPQGSLAEVQTQFKEGAIALSYLHSQGRLEWIDPFHYRLRQPPSVDQSVTPKSDQTMTSFLYGRTCRWQTIVHRFGFRQEAQQLGQCGHCDNCRTRK
jgi:ATP-dependent DNA helicase RecQ